MRTKRDFVFVLAPWSTQHGQNSKLHPLQKYPFCVRFNSDILLAFEKPLTNLMHRNWRPASSPAFRQSGLARNGHFETDMNKPENFCPDVGGAPCTSRQTQRLESNSVVSFTRIGETRGRNGVASLATTLGSLPRSKNQIEGETALPRAARLLGLAQRPTAMKIYQPQILQWRAVYTNKIFCDLILNSTRAQYFF